jgi:hypothetical protein
MAKIGFHKGWSGSPFHTGYEANEGVDLSADGARAEGGPRIGAGVLGDRVKMEIQRDGGRMGKGRRGRGDVEK